MRPGASAMATAAAERRFREALALHKRGQIDQAAKVYRELLRADAAHAGAWHLLGVVLHARGKPQDALRHIEQALSLCDSKAVYHNNYGAVLRDLDRHEEASSAFRRAIELRRDYPDAHANLGLHFLGVSDYEAARSSLQEALRWNPRHVDALLHLGELDRTLGRFPEAERAYRRVLGLVPDHVKGWLGLGHVLLAGRRPTDAVAALQRAVELAPDDADVRLSLARAYADEGRVTESAASMHEAFRLRPERTSWQYRRLSLCPAVFPDVEALGEYRRDLEARLDAATEPPFAIDWKECLRDGFAPPFELSHHGCSNRVIKEKFARFFASSFPQRPPPLRKTGRPRIGFLVTRGRERGFVRDMAHVVARIDGKRFEPVVLCPAEAMPLCQRSVPASHVQWVVLPRSFTGAVECIGDAAIDLLYHRQIGTDPFNYFLPFARAAPIQCTGWATHGTSGLSMVDYYLSSKLIEVQGAEEHYTEQLYLFDTFPTCQSRIPQPAPTVRADFALPASGGVYFCPHRIQKFHPDFDVLLKGVLESDPAGTIVALEGRHPVALARLKERFRRTLGETLMRRVVFAPSMPPSEYYRLLSLADVVLDAPHYSASLTGFDAFSLGVPIVTLPGVYNVERYAVGLYRRMGIEGLIADTPSEYVDLAVRLGTDRECCRHWRQQIVQRSEILFEDDIAVRDHERFFQFALDHASRK